MFLYFANLGYPKRLRQFYYINDTRGSNTLLIMIEENSWLKPVLGNIAPNKVKWVPLFLESQSYK